MTSGRGRFVDRILELGRLDEAWASGEAQLIIVSGRRRVGKTELLARFSRGKPVAYIAAAQRLRSDQLADAARDLAALANRFRSGRPPAIRLDDWQAMLDLIAERATERRIGVVIDEFPYLVEQSPELPSLLQRWWDQAGSRTKIFLVLAGSDQALVDRLVSQRAPLFGRATMRPRIEPMDYYNAARFVPAWPPVDRVRGYAVAGGMPYYLRLFDPSLSLRANLQRLAFSPDGALFREAEYLLEAEFREVSRRGSIFRAIARGAVTPNEIAQRIGLGGAADVQANLADLVRMGLLERVVPVTRRAELRSRQVAYRIADPYLAFYFTILEPRRSVIQMGPPAIVDRSLPDEELDAYVSRLFEEVARQYVRRAGAAGAMPIVHEVGTWWQGEDEVDVVGVGASRVELVGEVKWSRSPVGQDDLELLRRRARSLGDGRIRLVLVSRSGFTRSVTSAPDVITVGLRELFARELAFERDA
ncbi:MAG TPA: ATP-binding protein [Candidatus Limnocylindrales bacterium]|nr:ATP-binding protein [Candidatus Limnocylindrales bacterium]